MMEQAQIDEFVKSCNNKIAEFGHIVIGTGSNGKHLSYTIGLFEKFGYELILSGTKPDDASCMLNDIVPFLPHKQDVMNGQVYDQIAQTYLFLLRDCKADTCEEHCGAMCAVHGRSDVPVVQMVLCDKNGYYPWEESFDHEYMDRRSDTFFTEPASFNSEDEKAAVEAVRAQLAN